jgi:AraC-like DNA-binding protein
VVAVTQQESSVRITGSHRHARGQLLGATHGLLSVDAGDNRWVVPATHAVWVPPEVAHGLRSHGPFSGWSVYVAPTSAGLPDQPCVLAVSGLLREAVARAAGWGGDLLTEAQLRVTEVIVDEIRASPHVALGLPIPQEPRLRRIAMALSEQPADDRSLEHWATWAAIAPRTLTRRFVAETGFSFTQWRQRARLLRALELLAAGHSVTSVALDLGYDNVSAFIALFRRTFGVTPARYFSSAVGNKLEAP